MPLALSLGLRHLFRAQLATTARKIFEEDLTTGNLPASISVTRAGNTATRVAATGLIETVNANIGRVDYDPATLAVRGLLIEGARTQLLGTTEALTAGGFTVTANDTTAPTGATTAERFVPTVTDAQHRIDMTAVTADGTSQYTISSFHKIFGTTNYPGVRLRYFDSNSAFYNIDAVTVGTVANATGRIQSYANSWKRCQMTGTPTAAAHTPRFNVVDDAEDHTYPGDTVNGQYIWGVMLEAGGWASSYIANSGAAGTSVVRAADTATTAASTLLNFAGTELSVAVDGRSGAITTQAQQTFWEMGDGTADNRVSLIRDVSQRLRWQVVAGGVSQADIDIGACAADTTFHAALALKVGSARGVMNGGGVAVAANPPSAMPTGLPSGTIWYGRSGVGSDHAYGWLRKVTIWNNHITDAELGSETVTPPPPPPPPPGPPGNGTAFPGAVGFGKNTRGGRGGAVIRVTNLNDSGTGSLRAALITSGARIVVFDIAGTITISSALSINNPFITIQGHRLGTAITGNQLQIVASEVIIRHISFHSQGGPPSSSPDALAIFPTCNNIIIDHCDIQYGEDETFQLFDRHRDANSALIGNRFDYRCRGITISNCLISESMSGKGIIMVGCELTMYRNLTAYVHERLLARINADSSIEIINCVGFNSESSPIVTGDNSWTSAAPVKLRIQNNWIIPGPQGPTSAMRISAITAASFPWVTGSEVYHSGNSSVGGVVPEHNWPAQYVRTSPTIDSGWITGQIATANAALETTLLANVGARPNSRHAMATRTINRIIARTGGFMGADPEFTTPTITYSTYGGYINLTTQTEAFPTVANPSGDDDNDGWTNIEEVLFAQHAALAPS